MSSNTTTASITIRSTIKKMDEMTFDCPLSWTITQLKIFIFDNHTKGRDYFKPEKTQLFFGGKILDGHKTVNIVLNGKDLSQNFTFLSKFSATTTQETKEETAEEAEIRIQKAFDEYASLFQDNPQLFPQHTNMDDLEVLSKLPVGVDRVSKMLIQKNGTEENAPKAEAAKPRQQILRGLIVKILLIIIVFGPQLQKNFAFACVLIGVFVLYFLMKANQERLRAQNEQRQLQAAINNNPQNNNNNDGENPGQEQVANQGQAAGTGAVVEDVRRVKPSFSNKAKEFVLCFVSSLFPSWDMNLYIQNNQVEEPAVAAAPAVENAENNLNEQGVKKEDSVPDLVEGEERKEENPEIRNVLENKEIQEEKEPLIQREESLLEREQANVEEEADIPL